MSSNITNISHESTDPNSSVEVATVGEEDITAVGGAEGSLFFLDVPARRLLVARALLPPAIPPAHVVGE